MEVLKKNISKVKMRLMRTPNTTFFSALLANLKIVIAEIQCMTAATDGISLYLDPRFIEKMPLDELLGLILHEVLHVAFDHIKRCLYYNLNKNIYNIAADHYINLMILAMGYKLPAGGYCDPAFKGMSTMQIYNILIKNPPPNSQQYVMDILAPPKDMPEQLHVHTITANILNAVTQAKMRKEAGSIPGEILRNLESILNPKLPWENILQNWMQPYHKNDYSWGRPNKRYTPSGYYLPQMKSEALIQITAGCDVSGSMSNKDLKQISPELVYIWETLRPEKFRLMTFDTKVHLDRLYVQGEQLDLIALKGGGGTNIVPLINSILEESPEVALIFTDGYFTMPDLSKLTTDIIWIIKNNPRFSAPIGQIIHMEN